MSEENSNEDSNNEENEEGEEKEDDEEKEEDEDNEEGEEKEDDEEKEGDDENEGEEKEEEEDEDGDKKKKKKKDKKGKKDKGKTKKEAKEKDGKKEQKKENTFPDKNPKFETVSTGNNILFNGNDITVGNIAPKKTTIQLLMEISTDMESLSSHIDKTMPIKPIPPVILNNYSDINNNYTNMANISFAHLDKEDLEIKQLINKANELSNMSKINRQNEIKTFENKLCQSDEDNDNEFYNQEEEKETYNNDINYNNINERRNDFPYDPYKHLGYYNNLKNRNRQLNNNNFNNYQNKERKNYGYNKNNNASFNSLRVKKMDELYNLPNNTKKQPIIYTQPQSNSNTMRNRMVNKYNENFDLNEMNNTNNKNGRDNLSDKNDENENYENNNYNNYENNMNNNNNNNYNENISNNNNYINNNFGKRNDYENDLNIEDNNNKNNFYPNKTEFDRNKNNYERFRPRSINHAMNILLDKE